MGTTGDLFGTALSGLRAFQRGLHVTSHNVANSATEGYSRQRVEFSSRSPVGIGSFTVGAGVDVDAVRRLNDEFIELQILNYSSSYHSSKTLFERASNVDDMLTNDFSNLSMNFQRFFDSIQDVNNNPSSIPVRQIMLSEAGVLVEQFHSLSDQFSNQRIKVNREIADAADRINDLAKSISGINLQILSSGNVNSNFPANDLLDQRDTLVKKLSELVNVTTLKQKDGTLNVSIGNGQSLVLGSNYNMISTTPNYYDPEQPEIAVVTKAGSVPITQFIKGGELGGLLEFRSNVLTKAENSVGRMAAGLSYGFNQQHRLGMDMDGGHNAAFFTDPQAVVASNKNNAGTGVATAVITDVGKLTTADYQLTYNGSDYLLRDVEKNTTTTIPGGGPFPYDTGFGFTLSLSGVPVTGDSFLVRPTRQASADIALTITDPRKYAAAAPLRLNESTGLNSGLKATLQINDYTDTNLASQNIQIRISSTSPDLYEMYDVTGGTPGVLMGGGAYNSGGMSFAMNGWQLNLSGAPQLGDVINVESNADGVGDNTNSLALSGLQTLDILEQGTMNYQEAYSSMVSVVGTVTRQSDSMSKAQETMLSHAVSKREAISGVNLDEEAANLLKYQQAYQASSRVLATANLMFETLLDAFR